MGIADVATVGNTVAARTRPDPTMAADDVATAVGGIALEPPANGIVEIVGPEQFHFDELIRRRLAAQHDPRRVITDPHARYFGAE